MKLEELDVFRLGHELTLQVYLFTANFPVGERFGLVSQMRRSAVSICSNLAEGYHRESRNEFRHFVSIARGSTGELRYQVLLSKDLGYIDQKKYTDCAEACDRISRMLSKLAASLSSPPHVTRSSPDADPPHAARRTQHDS